MLYSSMNTPEQINLYVAEQPEWQRLRFAHLRRIIHAAAPLAEETWWHNAPAFKLDGRVVLGINAQRTGLAVVFPLGAKVKDPKKLFEASSDGKEQRTYRVKEQDTINEAAFADLVTCAVQVSVTGTPCTPGQDDFVAVLRRDAMAWANWEAFSEDQRSEYMEWVCDGRKEETRKRRMAQAFEAIREGERITELRLKGA